MQSIRNENNYYALNKLFFIIIISDISSDPAGSLVKEA